MARLQLEVEQLTRPWLGKGHKANRRRQRNMMRVFAQFAEGAGAQNTSMLGPRTVISFWKHMRGLGRSYATQMDHWRALRELWALAGIAGEVPAPRCPDASIKRAGVA